MVSTQATLSCVFPRLEPLGGRSGLYQQGQMSPSLWWGCKCSGPPRRSLSWVPNKDDSCQTLHGSSFSWQRAEAPLGIWNWLYRSVAQARQWKPWVRTPPLGMQRDLTYVGKAQCELVTQGSGMFNCSLWLWILLLETQRKVEPMGGTERSTQAAKLAQCTWSHVPVLNKVSRVSTAPWWILKA